MICIKSFKKEIFWPITKMLVINFYFFFTRGEHGRGTASYSILPFLGEI